MPAVKFAKEQLARIRTFLEIGWSFSVIKRKLKQEGTSISDAYLSKLKNCENRRILCNTHRVKRTVKLRRLSPTHVASLKRLVLQPNPPTQRDLGKRFGCSRWAIRYAIRTFNLRLVKKPKGHFLSAATTEKRRRRSWPLYLRLRKDRWRSVITSDEAWVYLTDTGRKRSVQYISREKKQSDAEPAIHIANPRGVMVWVGMSANGLSRPQFIDAGAKINAVYYQQKVLEPFFTKELAKLYPNRVYLFHQDSAPSKAKSTMQWLRSHRVPFITPEQWMPSSPDASPCDFFLWGYLKAQLNKKAPRTVDGLKKPS